MRPTLLLCSLLSACGPYTIGAEMPSVPTHERALAIGKSCAADPPSSGLGHHGRALLYERAKAERAPIDGAMNPYRWIVHVPESGAPTDAFVGVDVYVYERDWSCNGIPYR